MCFRIDTLSWSGMTIHRAVESRHIKLHMESKKSSRIEFRWKGAGV